MKVHEKHHPENMDGVTGSRGAKQKSPVSKSSSTDKTSATDSELSSAKVNLSDRAQDMKKIREKIDSMPDVDEAKVAKFKKMIAGGQYSVDSKAVADRMVDEHAYGDLFRPDTEE